MSERCPSCGSTDVAHLAFGLINSDVVVANTLAGENIVYAGCIRTSDHKWQCNTCRLRFGGTTDPEYAPEPTPLMPKP